MQESRGLDAPSSGSVVPASPGGGPRLVAPAAFLEHVAANPFNEAPILLPSRLGLNQCHLTAGCLFQSVWNHRSGRDTGWGVKDYDVFYFDDTDLSWEAEDAAIRRVATATAHLPIEAEVKNQARVDPGYEQRFGRGYPQLGSARDGISRYPVRCTCVGVEARTGELCAPYGLDDLAAGRSQPNPLTPDAALFRAKAESYRRRWPWLEITD